MEGRPSWGGSGGRQRQEHMVRSSRVARQLPCGPRGRTEEGWRGWPPTVPMSTHGDSCQPPTSPVTTTAGWEGHGV